MTCTILATVQLGRMPPGAPVVRQAVAKTPSGAVAPPEHPRPETVWVFYFSLPARAGMFWASALRQITKPVAK